VFNTTRCPRLDALKNWWCKLVVKLGLKPPFNFTIRVFTRRVSEYLEFRKAELTKMSQHWINKSAEILWNITHSTVS
jgi:hypothetical protein